MGSQKTQEMAAGAQPKQFASGQVRIWTEAIEQPILRPHVSHEGVGPMVDIGSFAINPVRVSSSVPHNEELEVENGKLVIDLHQPSGSPVAATENELLTAEASKLRLLVGTHHRLPSLPLVSENVSDDKRKTIYDCSAQSSARQNQTPKRKPIQLRNVEKL
jgi:hypothetical protein